MRPGAGEAHVEVEPGAGLPRDDGEAGSGAGEGARRGVRRRQLPHQELPRRGPAMAHGEDELRLTTQG